MSNNSGGRSRRRIFPRAMLGAGLLTVTTVLGASACSSSNSGDSGCVSTRTYFEKEVWSAFMSTTCTKCHTPDGFAVAEKNAKLVLQPPGYPGFFDANIATLKEVSKLEYEGTSELILKPIGAMNHGGGAVIEEGGKEHDALIELVERLANDSDSCEEAPNSTLANMSTLDPPSTLRKASLNLVGRLPTQAEKDAVAQGGDAALDAALDGMMKEDAFYERISEIFNDVLLTDRFLENDRSALNFLDNEDYPGVIPYKDDQSPLYDSEDHFWVNYSIAREPLNLINYVIKNDKPYTDVLTAEYAVVNPYLAAAYGITGVQFKDAKDRNELVEAKVTTGKGIEIPHAGVLSTPAFLNRWQTTETNRNRGRARRLFLFFLATDVLKLAERPVDATKVTAQDNPTLNATSCTVCHKLIDPVAGGFRGYDVEDYEHFDPMAKWHDDMFEPGFGSYDMDPEYYDKALAWLGPKMAYDPRFAIGTVQTVYKGLTGKEPLGYPRDNESELFAARAEGWQAQDTFFRETAEAFKKSNYNFKTIVKAVIKSPYYRATYGNPLASAKQEALGTGRLLTPEMLNRKIAAVTGYRWRKPNEWDKQHDWLLEDYKMLYGGIDSFDVPTRLTSPNSLISSIGQVMANEMACRLTAFDFTNKEKEKRSLFPKINPDEVPESAGHTVDGAVLNIKTNIQHLHELLLDEKLDLSDPEIERTYQLFLDTWHELSMSGDKTLPSACSGRMDPATGKDIPMEAQLKDDANFTIRSWMAVMSYLLSDWRFLHE
jgi:hypothetical protein